MTLTGARYALLVELARTVTARRDLDDVLAATFQGLRRIMPFDGGSIQLVDDEGWIRLAATVPPAPEDVLALRIPLGTTLGGRIILGERPVYVPDVRADQALAGTAESDHVSPGGLRAYFGVPLIADGRALGLVQIDSRTPDAWDDDERALLTSIAPVVAAAIQNARAHDLLVRAEERAAQVERRAAELADRADQLAERQAQVNAVVSRLLEVHVPAIRSAVIGKQAADEGLEHLARLSAVLTALVTAPVVPHPEEPAVPAPARAASLPGPRSETPAPAPRLVAG